MEELDLIHLSGIADSDTTVTATGAELRGEEVIHPVPAVVHQLERELLPDSAELLDADSKLLILIFPTFNSLIFFSFFFLIRKIKMRNLKCYIKLLNKRNSLSSINYFFYFNSFIYFDFCRVSF